MLVTILPFFLAARIVNITDPYQNIYGQLHGFECTYDVLVNMSLSHIVNMDETYCSMIGAELKCRPKGTDTLSCHFANGKIVRPDPGDTRCVNARNYHPIKDRFVNTDPFEIRFNSRGIENLVVTRTTPRWRIDMIRSIVEQLNIGFELEKGYQRFIAMENSSIGYCEVEVKMTRPGYGRGMGDLKNDADLHIVFEPERPDIVPLSRAILDVEKVRYQKKCPNRKAYFFGNLADFTHGDKKLKVSMDMTSSVTHIHVSEKEIRSYTETMGVMKMNEKDKDAWLHQKISLSLKHIGTAQEALPEIPNPASTSLHAYSNIAQETA